MTDKLLDHLKRALGDAYTIERELSGGGMSRVFVAREHSLGREVVIKVLPKELAAGVNRDRFQQEVQLAARLSHPYIVPLLHAGEHEDLLWFTMPFITGESLRYRLEHQGPLPVRDALQLAHDAVEALAYAHSRGVIHRDIKPANILVDGGHAVVTDFGVAKALSAAMPSVGAGHTTTGMAIGTPAYMAPEQLAADPAADHRVDIYAMGLLMYELLAGASPFATPSPTATMTAQLTRMPDPLNQVRKDVPPAFAALIMRCLAKSPDERPATADDILKDLDLISGQLAAEAHGTAGSRKLARLIPVMATLGVVAVVAAASFVLLKGKQNAPAGVTPAVPAAPAAAGADSGPGQTIAITPLTREDSLRFSEVYRNERANGVAQKNGQTNAPASAPNLDSLVAAAVDSRLKEMGITNLHPGTAQAAQTGNIGKVALAQVGDEFSRSIQRKVVVEAWNPSRRGGVDSTTREITDQLILDLDRQVGSNWQIVRSEPNRQRGPNDTLLAGANAVVFVTVAPGRSPQDSMELFLTVRNPAGGQRFLRRAVPSDPTPADFQNALKQVSSWLRDLRINPAQGWEALIPGGAIMTRPGGGGPPGGPQQGQGQGRGGSGGEGPRAYMMRDSSFRGDAKGRAGGGTGSGTAVGARVGGGGGNCPGC